MKRILLAVLLLVSSTVSAQHNHGYNHYRAYPHNHYGSGYWIAPAIIGGVVGYALAQPRVIYTPPPPVIYPPAPLVNMPPPPWGYHYESVLDQNCNCYRIVLMPNP